MAKLVPIPFGVLVTRLLSELERGGAVFDLPRRKFFSPDPDRDVSVEFHGHRAATAFGPAAGPNSQLAQNIALSWLAGGRVVELKTVQVRDDLVIPRPCIDAATVAFNIEWSQELTLRESLEEYVKGAMLVELLKAAGVARGSDGDTVFDLSVGYDLAGIRSEPVQAFVAGMMDARALVDRFRAEIPARWAHLRDLAFPSRISDTVTLSTFHGCPPEEIEAIGEFLLEEQGLHLVVKVNPTLLGEPEVRELLHDRLGYRDLEVPSSAFERDARWDQVVGFVGRLRERARGAGRGFGVKCTNTLIVRNHKRFFPSSEKEMYLSGPPLHVLAMALVRRFRRTFDDVHVSFSGGVDAENFADCVALGLKPVTVCADLLGPGGYGRASRYFENLHRRMREAGARDLELFSVLAYGRGAAALDRAGLGAEAEARCRAALATGGDLRAAAGPAWGRWVGAARVLDTEWYADRLLQDERYGAARNSTPPRKVGTRLHLFDCLTCDKCIPVCPNDANFTLPVASGAIPMERLVPRRDGFDVERVGSLPLARARQIANFADACNACGHCDVMCPEDGGPYVQKPRFFGTVEAWRSEPGSDGFVLERTDSGITVHARLDGSEFVAELAAGRARYRGAGFDVSLDPAQPADATGRADVTVDLTPLRIVLRLVAAVEAAGPTNWVGAALAI